MGVSISTVLASSSSSSSSNPLSFKIKVAGNLCAPTMKRHVVRIHRRPGAVKRGRYPLPMLACIFQVMPYTTTWGYTGLIYITQIMYIWLGEVGTTSTHHIAITGIMGKVLLQPLGLEREGLKFHSLVTLAAHCSFKAFLRTVHSRKQLTYSALSLASST